MAPPHNVPAAHTVIFSTRLILREAAFIAAALPQVRAPRLHPGHQVATLQIPAPLRAQVHQAQAVRTSRATAASLLTAVTPLTMVIVRTVALPPQVLGPILALPINPIVAGSDRCLVSPLGAERDFDQH